MQSHSKPCPFPYLGPSPDPLSHLRYQFLKNTCSPHVPPNTGTEFSRPIGMMINTYKGAYTLGETLLNASKLGASLYNAVSYVTKNASEKTEPLSHTKQGYISSLTMPMPRIPSNIDTLPVSIDLPSSLLMLKGLSFKAFEYCCQAIYILIRRESILLGGVILTCQAVPVKQCCLDLKNTVMLRYISRSTDLRKFSIISYSFSPAFIWFYITKPARQVARLCL